MAKAKSKKKPATKKPAAKKKPFEMLDYFLSNVALNPKFPLDTNISSTLAMFSIELKSDYKKLKKEAAQILERREVDQIVALAAKMKIAGLDGPKVEEMLKEIVDDDGDRFDEIDE